MSEPKLVLVEYQSLIREMLVGLVREKLHFKVVAESETCADGIRACLKEKPQIVISGWSFPDGNAFDLVREVGRTIGHTRFLCISSNDHPTIIHQAVEMGVHGFILTRSVAVHIGKAVEALLSGDTYYCPESSKLLLHAVLRKLNRSVVRLTPRERQVLQGLARGENVKAVAARLNIEPKTVHNHLSTLKDKLGIHEPAGLVRYAMQEGYVDGV